MPEAATNNEVPQLRDFTEHTQYRAVFDVVKDSIDEEARTVELAFSSEDPYLRWFGWEILDHGTESIRLGRLKNSGPVLMDHNSRDLVGVVEVVKIDSDRVGRATVRFGRSVRASEIFTDVIDRIRTKISVGYRVHEMVLEKKSEDGEPTYRVTDWEPLEVSFVAVPADDTVGVGRSVEEEVIKPDSIKEAIMPEEIKETTAAPAVHIPPDTTAITNQARTEELSRMRDISQMGKDHNAAELAEEHIEKGTSLDDFRQVLLQKMATENGHKAGEIKPLDLSEGDVKRYSLVRGLNALANPQSRSAQAAAAFEFEVSAEAARLSGKTAQGLVIPPDITESQRYLNVGSATAGGNTVATELGDMIGILRNKSVIAQVGATVLSGLQGDLAFPRQTGTATGYWVAEGADVTESEQTIGQVPMSPKTLGAFTEYGRKLLLQSSIDIENFVRNDLARVIALTIDLSALYGSGAAAQPTGVKNQTGVGAPAAFAGANPTFAEVVDMETTVAAANADDGTMAYVMAPGMRGAMKSTEKFASTGQTIWEPGNSVNGYNAAVSNQVTAGDLFFGDWLNVLIGMWGGLDVLVNPFAKDISGTVRITSLQSMDIACSHPEGLAYNT